MINYFHFLGQIEWHAIRLMNQLYEVYSFIVNSWLVNLVHNLTAMLTCSFTYQQFAIDEREISVISEP